MRSQLLALTCGLLVALADVAHQPADRYATFSDADFRLGLNAAQTTLAAIVQLAGVRLLQ
jgi:hypothetical protein